MARISDTTPEAEAFLRQLLRSMPFERKWRQMSLLGVTDLLERARKELIS